MEKAKIYDPDRPADAFYVQFNPNSLEYSISSNRGNGKGVRSKPADGGAREEHLQSDPTSGTDRASLCVKLFYHTFFSEKNYSDVRLEIEKIRAFVRGSGNTGPANDVKIAFSWGTITHVGMLDSFSVSYQMFASDGTPVQAEVSITITGEDPDRTASRRNRVNQRKETRQPSLTDEQAYAAALQKDWAWMFQ